MLADAIEQSCDVTIYKCDIQVSRDRLYITETPANLNYNGMREVFLGLPTEPSVEVIVNLHVEWVPKRVIHDDCGDLAPTEDSNE